MLPDEKKVAVLQHMEGDMLNIGLGAIKADMNAYYSIVKPILVSPSSLTMDEAMRRVTVCTQIENYLRDHADDENLHPDALAVFADLMTMLFPDIPDAEGLEKLSRYKKLRETLPHTEFASRKDSKNG